MLYIDLPRCCFSTFCYSGHKEIVLCGGLDMSPGRFVKPTNCLKTSAHAIYAKVILWSPQIVWIILHIGLHWIQLNVLEDNDRHSEVINGVNGVSNGNFHRRCLTICKTKALPRVAWSLVSPRCIWVQSHISMICHTMPHCHDARLSWFHVCHNAKMPRY